MPRNATTPLQDALAMTRHDDSNASTCQTPEAYWFRDKSGEITIARANRDPLDNEKYSQFLLNDGVGSPVPDGVADSFPTFALVPQGNSPPTNWILAGGYAVSSAVRSVIEAFEPKRHQFFPLTVQVGV